MSLRRTGWLVVLALRHFRRSRLHSILAFAAAVTGTGGVAVCIGYTASGRQKVFDQFSRMGTNLITPLQSGAVGNRARTGTIVTTLREADYRAFIADVPEIAASSPTVSTVMRVRAGDLTKNTSIIGCTPEYFSIRNWTVRAGSLFEERDAQAGRPVALLGATAARDLFGEEDPSGHRILIGNIPFVVQGVLTERGQGLDAANEDSQVYIPLQTAMHRLMNVDYFGAIVVQISSWGSMDGASARIASILDERHRFRSFSGLDFRVQNQKALLEAQLAAFGRLTFFLRWIAASTPVVASLGILAVAWIGVGQRAREIGTKRAIGATVLDVLAEFFSEGILGPATGCCVGIATAWFALLAIDVRMEQPFLFSVDIVAVTGCASLILYTLSTMICCLRAARVHPSVALRAE